MRVPDCRYRELGLRGLARDVAGFAGRLVRTNEKAHRSAVGNLVGPPSTGLTAQYNHLFARWCRAERDVLDRLRAMRGPRRELKRLRLAKGEWREARRLPRPVARRAEIDLLVCCNIDFLRGLGGLWLWLRSRRSR